MKPMYLFQVRMFLASLGYETNHISSGKEFFMHRTTYHLVAIPHQVILLQKDIEKLVSDLGLEQGEAQSFIGFAK